MVESESTAEAEPVDLAYVGTCGCACDDAAVALRDELERLRAEIANEAEK